MWLYVSVFRGFRIWFLFLNSAAQFFLALFFSRLHIFASQVFCILLLSWAANLYNNILELINIRRWRFIFFKKPFSQILKSCYFYSVFISFTSHWHSLWCNFGYSNVYVFLIDGFFLLVSGLQIRTIFWNRIPSIEISCIQIGALLYPNGID